MKLMLQRIVRGLDRKISGWVNAFRVMRLRAMGASVGKNVRAFGRFTIIGDPRKLVIGDNTTLNEGVFLNARANLTIGANVHLSPGCQIHTGGLLTSPSDRTHQTGEVVIGNNVWIASGAVVVPGVKIGEGSVVGALALVASDIEAHVLAAGVPARFKKRLLNHNPEEINENIQRQTV